MEQILEIENKIIRFSFHKETETWLSKTKINDIEIDIEIDKKFHNDEFVDWDIPEAEWINYTKSILEN